MNKSVLLQEVQLNLFHPRPSLPHWDQIPTEMQETARELLAQMLTECFDHEEQTSQQKEFIDE